MTYVVHSLAYMNTIIIRFALFGKESTTFYRHSGLLHSTFLEITLTEEIVLLQLYW